MATSRSQQHLDGSADNIDAEHRVQLGLIDALHDAVRQGNKPTVVGEILDQFIAYSELHFVSEELLMRLYAYPDYADHMEDHQALIENLRRIKTKYQAGDQAPAMDAARHIKDLLLGHIQGRDHAFAEYLRDTRSSNG